MSILLDGKETARLVREQIKDDVAAFSAKYHDAPTLAVIIVGEDPASEIYVRNKHKACLDVGMHSQVIKLPSDVSQEILLSEIARLNQDADVNGILVQLPLPKHLNEQAVISAIAPEKDVDAFHPQNVGRIMIGSFDLLPCTPAGVMELLHQYKIQIDGRHCVIVGRSNIVGKPQAMLMLKENATVTICHSHTKNLADLTKSADILIVAVGKPRVITADMVKEGATVVDVGINRVDGKLCGDVDFESVEKIAAYITPVPGGVGPMTITMLLKNTLTAAIRQQK
ncbi:MAG: bifunctional methylenetetrahydrofolate dehydrogenase/methenyltetrahydrofolate cyclohydrolase FolD [Clostridia bacterium]|nr:bifunctional methylenetetrahydrofolate dehydrogenase/methenyltetrahydrofolate cyclohydrolase FolD [Clostridia bacterium]